MISMRAGILLDSRPFMALLSLQNIRIAFGGPFLLDGVTLQIEPGERICLVGRNGEGKSTLLKIVNREIEPDEGRVVCDRTVRIARLAQEVPGDMRGTVREVVAADWTHEHGLDHPVERTLSLLGLEPDQSFATLSGGMRRRALLASALVHEPDLLILDEPTNHLDIESIQWLEAFLLRWPRTLLFVTHDRVFLQKLATRIIELDRGQLTSWACDYSTYLERRKTLLEAEEGQWAQFDKKLAQEEQWIRQGIKARRTRNEGRVRELEALRRERAQRRERTGTVTLQQNLAERPGQNVMVVKKVSHAYGGTSILADVTITIHRGQHIGIIGPNGCGKTTLLQILLGILPPQQGEVKHGTRLEIAYFDQHRLHIDPERTVQANLCGDEDYIVTPSGRRHVIGYLRDFLFSPDTVRQPAGSLSGGERNRLMLAKLFARPSNVLVLDEPTNDLDIETLDLLEELLAEYPGTVLLVSHDRAFLNHVVTDTLVFEGDGRIGRYVGGYDDWLAQRAPPDEPAPIPPTPRPGIEPARAGKARKPTHKEREELRGLPDRIAQLEEELVALQQQLGDPDFYRRPGEQISAVIKRAEALPPLIEQAYHRWTELEP